MSLERPPLTDRHLAVLRWIADGCPAGIWPGHAHKLLVGRLETLNLAALRRRHGKWHAVIQPDGQHYLQHGHYPGCVPSSELKQAASATAARARDSAPAAPARARAMPAKQLSPTELLIAGIVAAGGTLTITPSGEAEHRRLDAQIHAAQRHAKAPAGKQLIVQRPRWSTYILTLVDVPAWMAAPVTEVTVPAQLRAPHGAVAALRNDEHLLAIREAPRRRALLLLQALADAATKRGHAVAAGTSEVRYGRRQAARAHLLFTAAGHQVGVRVSQLSDRSDHVPTAKELADKRRYGFYSIPRYDYAPSDRLRIEITGHGSGSWTDGVRKKLEDRLDEVLRAIERAADAAEHARAAAEHKRRQEQLEHERCVAKATQRLIEANRVQILDAEVSAWSRARQMDDYIAAMTTVVEQIDNPDDGAAATEWLDWARHHAESINPLRNALAVPADPEPTHASLQPYLDRSPPSW